MRVEFEVTGKDQVELHERANEQLRAFTGETDSFRIEEFIAVPFVKVEHTTSGSNVVVLWKGQVTAMVMNK